MLLTLSVAFPVFEIVKVCNEEELPTVQFPKARLPLTPIIGAAMPVPEQEMVLVPLVAFENTVIVPEFVPATVGVKVTATF